MNQNKRASAFFKIVIFLALIFNFSCYGQGIKSDTSISFEGLRELKWTIYLLLERVRLQELELQTLNNLGKVDSLRFGKDSLIVLFTSDCGILLKRVKQRFKSHMYNYEDSTIVYYNKSGLPEYQEMWQDNERRKIPSSSDSAWIKSRLTYRRYEYDEQNRLIREVVDYPTPKTVEYTYTYDASGNRQKKSRNIDPRDFWGQVKITWRR